MLRYLTIRVDELEEGPSAMMRKVDRDRERDDRGERRFGARGIAALAIVSHVAINLLAVTATANAAPRHALKLSDGGVTILAFLRQGGGN